MKPIIIAIILLTTILGIYSFINYSVPFIKQDFSNQPIGEIYGSKVIGQSFVATENGLNRIDIMLATYARENTEDVIFQLSEVDSAEQIVNITVDAENIEDNVYHTFQFDPIPESKGKSYLFTISSPESLPGNAITIWYSTLETLTNGTILVDNTPFPGDLRFKIYSQDVLFIRFHLLLIIGLVLGIIWFKLGHIRADCKKIHFLSFLNNPKNYYYILISLTILIAAVIRLYNITALDPYTDEYSHLLSAISLNEIGSTNYTRAFFLTYTLKILFNFFGQSLFIARIPGAIIGSLVIIPLFLLAKKVSNEVGIIASVLWALSPWAIGVSRTVREYAFFPFCFLLFILIIIHLIDNIIEYGNNRYNFSFYDLILIFLVSISFIYARYLDPLSTFKYIFLLVPPSIIYFLYRTLEISNVAFRKKIYIFIITFSLLLTFYALLYGEFLSILPNFDGYWLNLLLTNGWSLYLSHMSNSTINLIFYSFLLLSGFLHFGLIKKNPQYLLILLIILFEVYIFSFHWNRYMRPRYLFYILPFFLIALASGIFALYNIIQNFKGHSFMKYINIFLFIWIIFLIFNPINTYRSITWEEHGYVPMTDEYHFNLSGLIDKYSELIKENDVIISNKRGAIKWAFNININEDLYLPDNSSNIINKFNRGWIIIDIRDYYWDWKDEYPLNNFSKNDTNIKFLGKTDEWFIYSWGIDNQSAPLTS